MTLITGHDYQSNDNLLGKIRAHTGTNFEKFVSKLIVPGARDLLIKRP